MSYGGDQMYMPVDTVDESADYTDMMGQASLLNQASVPNIRANPTKMLIALWVIVLITYWLFGYFFRGYNV